MPPIVPAVHTIAAGLPFVDALAAGILDRHAGGRLGAGDPLDLTRLTVLLPTPRAVRSLRDAFLRLSDGRPVLLPRLAALGNVDDESVNLTLGVGERRDLPQAIAPFRRQLLLTRLILGAGAATPSGGGLAAGPAQAARLARDLASLLDEVQTEQVGLKSLATLVPDEYATHWQMTLTFLDILAVHWPAIVTAEGCVDPAEERNQRLGALAAAWAAHPPAHPVIAAGSTGSIPAAAELLKVVAGLPRGCVVLPGLDADMAADTWDALDDSHPQYGLRQTLARMGVARDQVTPWIPDGDIRVPAASPPVRAHLLAEALRPAGTTESWRHLTADPRLAADIDAALMESPSPEAAGGGSDWERPDWDLPDLPPGLHRLDAPTPQEEAGAIALILRQVLETPHRTAALVTPDRDLARRVAVALSRWGISVDDSAGRPLTETAVGSYLRLLADWAAEPGTLPLLSLLKHPLATAGLGIADFRAQVRALERAVWRGPRPAPGFDGLRQALTLAEDGRFARPAERARLLALVDQLETLLAPLVRPAQARQPFADCLRAHIAVAEALAASVDGDQRPVTGADRLWLAEDGKAAAQFIDAVRDAADGFPDLTPLDYATLITTLMAGQAVRPRFGLHPRLHILGLMEARLQQFDVMVLGGLNEGTWPPQAKADPWLSRPMRKSLGLPSPEQALGLTAHDFVQAAAARTVVLTRAERVEGTPTVPSRWLLRLDTVLKALGRDGVLTGRIGHWRDWAVALDQPDAVRPCPPPAPCPPVAARPRSLSVTQIETWMRDPYAIYARHILKLSPLDPLDADPGAADKGQFIHLALDRFVRDHPGSVLPGDALDRLLRYGRDALAPYLAQPDVETFWWPRFEKIAAWFIAEESRRREEGAQPLATEVKGRLTLALPGGDFTVTAKADRIDRLADGGVAVIDYKTGQPPTAGDVALGYAPQLPLEAAIAEAGGFPDVGGADTRVAALEFWRLSGGDPAGEIRPVKGDPADLAAAARDGLANLVTEFDRPETPYRSQPRPAAAPRYSDYDHLARVAEWAAGGEAGE